MTGTGAPSIHDTTLSGKALENYWQIPGIRQYDPAPTNVTWSQVQSTFKPVESDVLCVLDCCDAVAAASCCRKEDGNPSSNWNPICGWFALIKRQCASGRSEVSLICHEMLEPTISSLPKSRCLARWWI